MGAVREAPQRELNPYINGLQAFALRPSIRPPKRFPLSAHIWLPLRPAFGPGISAFGTSHQFFSSKACWVRAPRPAGCEFGCEFSTLFVPAPPYLDLPTKPLDASSPPRIAAVRMSTTPLVS